MPETVDSDILSFLRYVYFGAYTNPYQAASLRAYLDMNRTIRFHGLPDDIRLGLRKQIGQDIEDAVRRMNVSSQEEYDAWHRELCYKIQRTYEHAGVGFSIGQSQKWINMTIKYLYMLGVDAYEDTFKFFHIPLDNYVFDVAKKILKVERPKIPWSRWNSYDEQYMDYQRQLRARIDIDPLRWEFKYWLMEAKNQS